MPCLTEQSVFQASRRTVFAKIDIGVSSVVPVSPKMALVTMYVHLRLHKELVKRMIILLLM